MELIIGITLIVLGAILSKKKTRMPPYIIVMIAIGWILIFHFMQFSLNPYQYDY